MKFKFRCTECDNVWVEDPYDDHWPVECPDCDYCYCGDDMCCDCYGEGFRLIHRTDNPRCLVPPKGWRCSRGAGHEGPCAAREEEI